MNETWTDEEMKERLEGMGYDLTDDEGEYSDGIMAEIASMSEGHKWHDDE